MENQHSLVLVFLLIFPCLVPQTQGNQQVVALDSLHKAKWKGDSGIDTSLFRAIHDENASSRVHPQDGLKEKDRIERLPGQPQVGFSQYGGYVTVDESAGRALYYYFAEAHHSKGSLPLLLWLNGGPGCSSLGYGAMQELGPFRVYSDGKALYLNKYSWNQAANVLFLESPAGVGFSYSNTTSDYETIGDRKTALDNYVFLVNWLERFPEYKGREFYISGESYAGHYVPQLAHTIIYHNKKKGNKTTINLKGILIGNAAINDDTDNTGMYDFLGSHALVSQDAACNIKKYCNFSADYYSQPEECTAAVDEINTDIFRINIYNIYAPSCFRIGTTIKPKKASLKDFDPCIDYYVYAYLNRPDVQEAMHANVTKLTHDWEPCSDVLRNWTDSPSTVLPLIEEFMANGLRVWIFSGDIDGRIPVTSSQYSVKKIKPMVKTEWHPWYIRGEVGGYTQVFKGGLTFVTVRGAGHQVPSFQPERALSLIKHFLSGSSPSETTRYT